MRFCLALLLILVLISPAAGARDDALDLYNQACEAALRDERETALDLLRQALDAGFEDWRHALDDPDLQGLTNSRGFQDILTMHNSRLVLLSSEKGLVLRAGRWSDWEDLGAHSAFRLRWEDLDLAYEVRLREEEALQLTGTAMAPWQGGAGLMLTLAIPDGTSAFESVNSYHVALGKDKTSPAGALFVGGAAGWQPVHELAPRLENRRGGKEVLITGHVPWQTILPYHPLADGVLGFNLSLRSALGGPVVSLVPDPGAFAPIRRYHRYAPLEFSAESYRKQALVGRLDHSLVEGGSLQLDLSLYCETEGVGILTIDFLDPQKRSVLPQGPVPQPLNLEKGLTHITRQADFSALHRGPYRLKVDLETPGGRVLTWSSLILNLGAGWREEFAERIAGLPELQRTTGEFYLQAIEEAVDQMPRRRHPGSLTTTLGKLETFLVAGETLGSILPESGRFRVARPGVKGPQLITLFLPEGYRQARGLRPVVLWHDAPGIESRLADRLERFYSYGELPRNEEPAARDAFPVYLLPHPTPGLTAEEEVRDLAGLLDWAPRFFAADRVLAAGMDGGADPLVELLGAGRLTVDAALVFAGTHLEPWPGEKEAAVTARLQTGAAQSPPLTWLDFFKETRAAGQGKMLLSALRNSGYNQLHVQEIKGGVSLTQVADRLVLWAEETP